MAVTNGIPPMGFGTFGRTGSAGIDAIGFALETGYRHLDTAQSYGTERECGEALRRSGIARDAVFLTTKIAADNCRRGRLIESLKRSAEALGVDAVDLALIHWPVSPAGRLPMAEYLPELAEAQDLGLTRLIGVSNFTIPDIREAESILGTDWLATNQVERHPLLRNQTLVDACAAHAIAVTCYLPLARAPASPSSKQSPGLTMRPRIRWPSPSPCAKATSSSPPPATPTASPRTTPPATSSCRPTTSPRSAPSTATTARSTPPGPPPGIDPVTKRTEGAPQLTSNPPGVTFPCINVRTNSGQRPAASVRTGLTLKQGQSH